MENPQRLTVFDLRGRLGEGSPLTLLDVREPEERAMAAIAVPEGVGNVHVPLGEIPARLDEVRALGGLLVVYCHHGVRSMAAARWLAAQGVGPVANLDGGIDAWSLGVDPTVRRY